MAEKKSESKKTSSTTKKKSGSKTKTATTAKKSSTKSSEAKSVKKTTASSSVEKAAKKAVRTFGTGFTVLLVVFLAVGVAVGAVLSYVIMKEDEFTLKGKKEVTLSVGEEYVEEGATVKAFGKDYSGEVLIAVYDGKGNKLIALDTTVEGEYQLVYSVRDTFKWNGYQLIRKVTIGGENG